MCARRASLSALLAGLICLPVHAAADPTWSLADHLDQVVAYNSLSFELFAAATDRYRGRNGGLLMRTVSPEEDGTLKPYSTGMAVNGEYRPDQFLLAGINPMEGAAAEFIAFGCSRIVVEYGLCDGAIARGNTGATLVVEIHGNARTVKHEITVGENAWAQQELAVPGGEQALVRLVATRRNFTNTCWIGLTLHGDGRLGSREETLVHSPNRSRIHEPRLVTLEPSPHRVTAKPGYDILFYRDKPFLSYASKGHRGISHALQREAGVNTYYVEGMTFTAYWPEGADGVVIPPDSRIPQWLEACQQFDMPFKAPMSLAHCTPFLPAWLIQKESLGFEGHQMRRGGSTHASFIKPKTGQFHKQGIDGWVKPFLDQPVLFVFSQEDAMSGWDDYSPEALSAWRAWLRARFADNFAQFATYVGGIEACDTFDTAPYPERFTARIYSEGPRETLGLQEKERTEGRDGGRDSVGAPGVTAVPRRPVPRVGYPMRLSWLKLLWIQEAYGDYLADLFDYTRKLVPGVPLTQRYVNCPCGVYISRRVGADYSYTFGHLSTEGLPNRYGIGRKSWVGIYAHAGSLPLPRGGSIGKTYSLKIRRGPMSEAEWRLNAYTSVANGFTGFEYSPFFPAWGEAWTPAALTGLDMQLNEQGKLSAKVMGELLAFSKHMMHYEHHADVAVFHDAAFNCGPFSGAWSQSKAGIYTLIRETGYHPEILTAWDMTEPNLKSKKVLVLAGSTSIAPEVQDAVRAYVREGGTLVTVFCADGQGFPGCNSYAYDCGPRDSAQTCSFEAPPAVAHLGDVLGIVSGAGRTTHASVQPKGHGSIPLDGFNALVDEGRWVDTPACCERLTAAASARVTATFDDGAPALIEHTFGKGRAITFALDVGVIANNLTIDALYGWWSDLLASLGCRKALDTGNWRVHGGAWHDDDGNRVVFLVNQDSENAQSATLDGQAVELPPSGTRAIVMRR